MAVSANTLFHFTNSNSLKNILASQGLFPQYSDEHFEDILPENSIYRVTYIPLISFCDLTIIQLSRDSVHTQVFGDYGIGLTKKWGIERKVSPVIYVHKNSQPSNQLYNLIKLFRKYDKTHEAEETISTARRELVDSFKFIKPYQGRWQKGKIIEEGENDIVYYNEREWRYCPLLSQYKVLSGVKISNKKEKDVLNKSLKNKMVKFNVDDIKYIIIKKKNEIEEFVTVIDKMKLNQKQKNELITKIITFEEINEDY
jgi:hypothetical protein